MRSSKTSAACLLGACVLLIAGLFLWFDNATVNVSAPDLDDSGPAGEVGCSIAPWDAGLNDNRDGPGGEHSIAHSEEVATDCYSANTTRFKAGLGTGALAFVLLSVGVASTVRSTPPASRHSQGV